MSSIDEIKARIDIVDLVSETVKLRRAGKNYTGFCPFHANTRTPAFVVFPDSGTWRCFGQCNEGGDIFRFVMKKEGWDFTQALHYLADKAGVQLEALTPERQQEDARTEKLRDLLEEAVTFYRHQLLKTPAGQPALDYLKKRGLLPATIETFGLGYAPDAWDAAQSYFSGKGYSTADLLESGLVTERQGGSGTYDRFRNRILFPIRDGMGHMAGFGARVLNPVDVPKFLNSPQTALFDKGRLLYGLDQARKSIRAADQVVIVEGYLDVIALHQAGFTNAVSPMGTALTEDQLRLLKKFTRRIILALDADAAGEKATLRGLEVARQALEHDSELAFDARGLLRSEARLQADVRVTTLPPGEDPDDVVLRNPEEWKSIVDAAQPIVIHVLEALVAGRDLDDPKTKSEIAARVLPLIEDVPNAVEREAYRQRLARRLKVDERALMGTRPASHVTRRRTRLTPGTGAAQPDTAPADRKGTVTRQLEAHILRLLLRKPDALYTLDRALLKVDLARFSPQEMESADHQVIARLVTQALDQDQEEPRQFIDGRVPEPLQELFSLLIAPMDKGEPTENNLLEDLVRTVLRLRREQITRSMAQIRYQQEEQQQQGDAMQGTYRELVLMYAQTLAKINRALGQNLLD